MHALVREGNFVSHGGLARDRANDYQLPAALRLNQWASAGRWNVERERAVLDSSQGRIAFRFHARDVHLVLGPSADGKPVRFEVSIDGEAPFEDHGSDTDGQGYGATDGQRLCQLVRQKADGPDRLFEIQFLEPGVQAYVFTLG